MTDSIDKDAVLAIQRAAHNCLGVEIDLNGSDGFDELAFAISSSSDPSQVEAFVAELRESGYSLGASETPKARPRMQYRVYEVPFEHVSAMLDDEPSVGRKLSAALKYKANQIESPTSTSKTTPNADTSSVKSKSRTRS
jgi:hypothetical protein